MSTYAVKATFYVEAESEQEAERVLDDNITPELACNYEVADSWLIRR